ncbi:MAG TPA: hypothetical protein VGM43_00245 [Bryobacteraceae bacterium]
MLGLVCLATMTSAQPAETPQIEGAPVKPGVPVKTLQDYSTPIELNLANCPCPALLLAW